jgi:hypothetical protein
MSLENKHNQVQSVINKMLEHIKSDKEIEKVYPGAVDAAYNWFEYSLEENNDYEDISTLDNMLMFWHNMFFEEKDNKLYFTFTLWFDHEVYVWEDNKWVHHKIILRNTN